MGNLHSFESSRLEMKVGTGKFRTDRHHIPCIPNKYQIYKKIRNQKEIQENLVISKTESVGQFPRPNPRILLGIFRFLPEFIPEISVVFFPSLFPKLVLHSYSYEDETCNSFCCSLGASVFYIERQSHFLSFCT